MARCLGSFLPHASGVYFALISAVLALACLEAGAQDRSGADVFQKASFKSPKTCTVESSGEVTALVKNGVELSVTGDWDCDGVPDAYDNCVGMANASQTDADSNGIGDGCQSAAMVSAGPVKRSEDRSRKSEKKKSKDRSRKSEEVRKSKSKDTRKESAVRTQKRKR